MQTSLVPRDNLTGRLQGLLDQVWSLRPSWERPESFHECKSEVVAQLKGLIAEASIVQEGTPAIAAKAKAALRLLQTTSEPADPADLPTIVESPKDLATEASSPAPAARPTPPPLNPSLVALSRNAGLAELEQSIHTAVCSMTAILADIERLAVAAHASVTAYAAALVPRQSTLPATSSGNAAGINEERCAALLQQALQSIGLTSGILQREAAAVIGKRGGRKPRVTLPPQATTSAAQRQRVNTNGIGCAPSAVSALPELPPGRHRHEDLKTDIGRATAAELWLAGHTQQAIARHFSDERYSTWAVSVAIWEFTRKYGHVQRHETGPRRKLLVREALIQFRATLTVGANHPASLASNEQTSPAA